MNIVNKKICTKCKIEKDLCYFGYHPQTKDKLQCRCKECRKLDKKKHYSENKEKINKKTKKYYENNKEKLSDYQKKYREKNKEELQKKYKERYQKSPEKYYLKTKLYNEKNKFKVNEYKNKYNKLKKNESVLFKLKVLMRDRLSQYFKYSRINKNNTTLNIIGCLPTELKEYLEQKFCNGMSWDNHGKDGWHIDHIIPLSSAKTEEELYKLCHYTNLQPLWAKDNLSKGSKINSK